MKKAIASKPTLHPRNKHQSFYDFEQLVKQVPELASYLIKNPAGIDTIDFAIPEALVLLNKAILMKDYKVTYWELPSANLCPPIPGRADYIHNIADLLAENNQGIIPTGDAVKLLDIGTGANLIYPIIGVSEYDWQFVAAELDDRSLKAATQICNGNPHLKNKVELRQQPSKTNVLTNIIRPEDRFAITLCNPPFFNSKEEALSKTSQKLRNLGKTTNSKTVQNFGGQNNELWCAGGEKAFIATYIRESLLFKNQVGWFSSLVSNKDNLKPLQALLKKHDVKEVRVLQMAQGNKISRILAWRY